MALTWWVRGKGHDWGHTATAACLPRLAGGSWSAAAAAAPPAEGGGIAQLSLSQRRCGSSHARNRMSDLLRIGRIATRLELTPLFLHAGPITLTQV